MLEYSSFIFRNFNTYSFAFLLVLEHYHTLDGAYFFSVNKNIPYQIWHRKGLYSNLPIQLSKGYLINSGWREVIPHLGKNELKKLNRSSKS